MGTNFVPLFAYLLLYSYERKFLDNVIISGYRRPARSFNLCYIYIDHLVVFNNKKLLDYLKKRQNKRILYSTCLQKTGYGILG